MTVFQINLAIAIRDSGSISNAATELGISQPNASNSIKLLEKEIGFEIFKRTVSGIIPTERGSYFLDHARKMIKEHNFIMDIRKFGDIYRLRLGTPYYLDAVRPFLEICEKHRDDVETDFRYADVSIKEGIEEIHKYNLDIVFAPVLKSQIVGMINLCRQFDLETVPIGKLPAVINLRKDHPAVMDGRVQRISQGCDLMKDYPYLVDRVLNEDASTTGYNDSDYIQHSYKMYADNIDVRRRLLASTNAFFFGMKPSKGINETYGTASFEVPGIYLEIFCIVRKSEVNRREIQDYITLLKKELNIIETE